MSYKIEWLLQDRVIIVTIEGDHSATSAQMASNEIISLMDTSPYSKIHVLIDLSRTSSVPAPKALIQNSSFLEHAKLWWLIPLHIPNSVVHLIGIIVVQFMKTRIHIAKNLDDALAFLNDIDEDLPPLSKAIESPLF